MSNETSFSSISRIVIIFVPNCDNRTLSILLWLKHHDLIFMIVASQKFGRLAEVDLQALQEVLQSVLDAWHLSEFPAGAWGECGVVYILKIHCYGETEYDGILDALTVRVHFWLDKIDFND